MSRDRALQLVGLDWNTCENEVNTAYRRMSLKVHPDKNPHKDATAHFQELGKAHELLLTTCCPKPPEPRTPKQSPTPTQTPKWKPPTPKTPTPKPKTQTQTQTRTRTRTRKNPKPKPPTPEPPKSKRPYNNNLYEHIVLKMKQSSM